MVSVAVRGRQRTSKDKKVILKLSVAYDLEREFRSVAFEEISKKKVIRNGWLGQALEEAINLWLLEAKKRKE